MVSIPFGLWIQIASPYPHRLTTMYVLSLFNKIPEHFLILGILVALMLPHRRLPYPAFLAQIEGSTGRKILRWLGIAQPVTSDSDNPILAWFGLNWTSLFAISVSGLVFFMIHLGRANPLKWHYHCREAYWFPILRFERTRSGTQSLRTGRLT